ncbi:mitochondrial carrier [Phialemonium atrogriseum]|uniref:Mitochondrial carrier n=1 Tax=Phialemonium atrogriseum TaxID=1093897 RepID=A0AAJ0C4D5_9PEZI|nr:mitochondrial carrier [Phialemonium atrogriseum]KAK1767451.1 mitochondrial carrier [Phialemonium atrogriseum]
MTGSDASGQDTVNGGQAQAQPLLGPGLLPVVVIPSGDGADGGTGLKPAPAGSAATTGASAASVRALTSQAVAFYFRAPVKAFFRTRVDYLAYARTLQEQHHQAAMAAARASGAGIVAGALRWIKSRARATTPGVLASAVRHYGWRVVPDQVLPPLVANVGVGAVLYTSYLQILGQLHEESGPASRRVYPPPQPLDVLAAGFLAGGIQSVVAAPLDAVQARYDLGSSAAGMTGSGNPASGAVGANGNGIGRPQSMWAFSYAKLREIGVRGIFAGWGLSFLKDSMGSAVFFCTFEYMKAQSYYRFVTWYYGSLNEDTIVLLSRKRPSKQPDRESIQDDSGTGTGMPTLIKPHYAIEPAFLLLAGVSASFAQQVAIHPLSHVQVEHWERLEVLDAQVRKLSREHGSDAPRQRLRWRMVRAYYNAYRETWAQCASEAEAAGIGLRRWLYRGFWWNTIRQVPSTSAGLIIFELVRRKYGFGGDQVRINRDGYDILLH